MATKTTIGHSSQSEHSSTEGSVGDQTKKEVLIVENYDVATRAGSGKTFEFMLRPVSATVAEKSAQACEAGCRNDNIGYGQSNRDTLKAAAQDIADAKYGGDLTKVNLGDITTKCNCDCSSFMTICALIGGAKIDTYRGSPRTATMKSAFTKYGAYKVFTGTQYTQSVDYLRRGDILVRSRDHTIMILGSGVKAGSGDLFFFGTNENIPDQVKFIELTVNKVSPTCATVDCSVTVKKSESGDVISNGSIIKNHKWSYKIVPISDTKLKTRENKLSVGNKKFSFSIPELTPNTSYYLEILAKKDKEVDFSSHNVIFTTPKARPDSVNDLKINLSDTATLEPTFNISFKEPVNWNKAAGNTSGYRVSLFVNGKLIVFNDTLIKANTSTIDTVISLKDLTNKKVIFYGDTAQIGIQAWNKDVKNNLFFDNDQPKCSKAFYIIPSRTPINSTHLKVTKKFNRVIVHDNTKGA